jgi:hypothetical protein
MDKPSSSLGISAPKPEDRPVRDRLAQKLKTFEDLADKFSRLETIEQIEDWEKHMRNALGQNRRYIDEYNKWSVNHFRAPSGVEEIVKNGGAKELKNWLRNVSWKETGGEYEFVSSMMLYGHRLPNKGLFALGYYQTFWLVVRLNRWAISLPKTESQLRKSYKDLVSEDEAVLGLRYKRIHDETRETLFFFPLGEQTASQSYMATNYDRPYSLR